MTVDNGEIYPQMAKLIWNKLQKTQCCSTTSRKKKGDFSLYIPILSNFLDLVSEVLGATLNHVSPW
jgi:hypothetical protein